jgi:hypothetical protein
VFVRCAGALSDGRTLERSYRTYVTDSLYHLGRGQTLMDRWCVLTYGEEAPDTDPQEVIDQLLEGGLTIR